MGKNKSAKNNILYFVLAYICFGIAFIGIIYPLSHVSVSLRQVFPAGYLIFDLIALVALYVVIYKATNKMDNYFSGIRFVNYGRWISAVIISLFLIMFHVLKYL